MVATPVAMSSPETPGPAGTATDHLISGETGRTRSVRDGMITGMARRVLTGCRDCRSCTNSAFDERRRKFGRSLLFWLTGGIGSRARRKCRACGHPISIHGGSAR